LFTSRRRHTRWPRDWSSDVCSSDLGKVEQRSTNFVLDSATQIIQLLAILPQCGFRLQNVRVNLSARKYGNSQRSGYLKRAMRISRGHTQITIISSETETRKMLSCGGIAKMLRRAYLLKGSLIIGTRSVGPLQAFFQSQRCQRRVRNFLGQRKFLAGGQSDRSRQSQFLLGIIVAHYDQLLLPCLQLDVSAQ